MTALAAAKFRHPAALERVRAGEHHLRLSFAAEPSAITTALQRIQIALDQLEAHR